MRKPVAVDLFSGAGGLSEGFMQAGFFVAASVEVDRYAVETQQRNHTYHRRYRTEVICSDVQSVAAARLTGICARTGSSRPHVLIGGPPCRGFSRSNRRTRNMDNPENHLFRDFLRLVRDLSPLAVVLENVADLVRFEKGAVADEIQAALEEMGYEVHREVLNALHYGVPQRRSRVFFVAVEAGMKFTFPDGNGAGQIPLWSGIGDLPRLSNGHPVDEMNYRTPQPLTDYQFKRRNGKPTVKNNLVSHNNDLVIERYKHIPQGGNWEDIPEKLMQNYADRERCHHGIYRRLPEDEPSITIMNFRKNMLIHPREDRGLSVREAARIQSFDDDYVFCGPLMHQQQHVANAVPPLLARAVGRAVRHALGV
jgi:DNA (cytosine-5)-methyltransferase 1